MMLVSSGTPKRDARFNYSVKKLRDTMLIIPAERPFLANPRRVIIHQNICRKQLKLKPGKKTDSVWNPGKDG